MLWPSVASAHAERQSSTPEEGARLGRPPSELSISFTEPPTGDAVVEVVDGCNRDVLRELTISGGDVTGALGDGRPGRWSVSYQVVSAVDGHPTRGQYSFVVSGERDCSGRQTVAAPPPAESSADDSDFPFVPFTVASLALLAIAAVVRATTSPERGSST